MKPRILLIDEPHPKARKIMESVAYVEESDKHADNIFTMSPLNDYNIVYTQLTPIKINIPVFCPCTRIDHIQAPKIIYLDDEWKRTEGQNITSTAEHTWSLMLQLAKINRMQLSGKILGIIGYGRLGKMVAKYAKAFGMLVYGFDKNIDFNEDALSELLDNKLVCLEWLLQVSDIITLHVPLNEETQGMIGQKEFDMMKPGCLIVNTSRAEIVDIESLIHALDHGKIKGYADDFAECRNGKEIYYPNTKTCATYINVIRTPNIGGNCIEAREATDIYIANKIVKFIKEE